MIAQIEPVFFADNHATRINRQAQRINSLADDLVSEVHVVEEFLLPPFDPLMGQRELHQVDQRHDEKQCGCQCKREIEWSFHGLLSEVEIQERRTFTLED